MTQSTDLAHRYPDFIAAFRKVVEGKQAAIRRCEGYQVTYSAVCEAMRTLNLPHDCTIKLSDVGVIIDAIALDTDRWSLWQSAADTIQAALIEIGAIDAPIVPEPWVPTDTTPAKRWYCHRFDERRHGVYLHICVPDAGLIDYEVRESERTLTYTHRELVPRGWSQVEGGANG